MSEAITPAGAEQVRAAIRRAADASGVDFSLLLETARRESALNPGARAATSSAAGLFQFIDSTWLDMVRRHGARHGLGAQAAALAAGADAAARRDILALRADPELSARMAAELTRENASTLRARLGRAPEAGELYAAHVLGAGGALRLIAAAAGGAVDASALFPREAQANRGLFFAGGAPRSAQALLDRLARDAGAGREATPVSPALRDDAPLSPALAQALFALALLPLTLREEGESYESRTGLAAYSRRSETQ